MLFRSDLEDVSALPGIPGLWELYVERCDFDRADLLADIPALTSLSLRQAGLTSIDFAASLTGLTYLDLHWNEISDLTPLAGLTSLEHLNLVTNGTQDVSPLADLTSLTYLALDGNPVEDASPLSGMINLRRLGLGGTLVWDLAPLAGLVELESLDISGEYYDKLEYGEVDLAPLAGLLKLTHLNLEYNIISDFTPLAGLAGVLGEEAFKECIGHPTIIALIEDITLTDNRIVPILTCKIPIAPNGTAVTLEKYNYVSRLEVLDGNILQFHSTLTPVTEEVSSMFGYTTEDMLFIGILIVRATEEELAYIQAGQP